MSIPGAFPGAFPTSVYVTQGSGLGLGSSPNVPVPGTTINPETGKPHTAGITRVELEANRAAAAKGKEKDVSELSGREQAARQLAGGVASVASVPGVTVTVEPATAIPPRPTTPSFSLGGNRPITASPASASEVFESVAGSLEKLGNRAYNLLPALGREVPSTDPSPVNHLGASDERRPSIIDQVRERGNKLLLQVEDQVATTRKSLDVPGGVMNQFKGILGEISAAVVPPAAEPQTKTSTNSTPATTTTMVAQSVPSRENQGMLPGESSAGAGALPGALDEPGVAMLPDEKAAEGTGGGHYISTEMESVTAGVAGMTTSTDKTSAARSANTTGNGNASTNNTSATGNTTTTNTTTTTGNISATHNAIDTGNTPTTQSTRAPVSGQYSNLTHAAPPNEQASMPSRAAPAFPRTFSAGAPPALGALAPALPQTQVGTGAAQGATDLEILPEDSVPTEPFRPTTSAPPPVPRGSTTRTDSLASVTAIRGGHEGHRTGNPATTGVTAAAHSTGSPLRNSTTSGQATSLTLASNQAPGNIQEAVGHPSTRNNEGTSRSPGSYPKVDHGAAPHSDPAPSTNLNTPTASASATPVRSTATGTPAAPHSSPASASHQHERTPSGGEEGKKHGFLGKLKALSGKLK